MQIATKGTTGFKLIVIEWLFFFLSWMTGFRQLRSGASLVFFPEIISEYFDK